MEVMRLRITKLNTAAKITNVGMPSQCGNKRTQTRNPFATRIFPVADVWDAYLTSVIDWCPWRAVAPDSIQAKTSEKVTTQVFTIVASPNCPSCKPTLMFPSQPKE